MGPFFRGISSMADFLGGWRSLNDCESPAIQTSSLFGEGKADSTILLEWTSGGIQFDKLRSEQNLFALGPWMRYGQSKLASLLYARELAARYPQITSVWIHPGVVKPALVTDLTLTQKMLVYAPSVGKMFTLEQGTYNLLWAITAPKEKIKTGGFYLPVGDMCNDKRRSRIAEALVGLDRRATCQV